MGSSDGRRWGKSVAAYGENPMAAVTSTSSLSASTIARTPTSSGTRFWLSSGVMSFPSSSWLGRLKHLLSDALSRTPLMFRRGETHETSRSLR